VAGAPYDIPEAMLRERAHHLGLSGSIVFLPEVRDVRTIMAALDIGVIASTASEAICRVALEYLALGVPVVGTDLNSIPEIVPHGTAGLIVPPGDAATLAQAILRLLGSPVLLENLGSAGPLHIRQNYSLTRLVSSGVVQVPGSRFQVGGLSWMDHEYSTSYLGSAQVGWDWFAFQLDDGSEVMLFRMRNTDGSISPFSSGTLIAPDGNTRTLGRDDIQVEVGATWHSPHSGATYPAQWTIQVPSASLTLRVEPYLADQELDVSYQYWEGAVRLEGEHAGRGVRGSGYVELTGYAGSMQGQF
jgi:hypothetical protein